MSLGDSMLHVRTCAYVLEYSRSVYMNTAVSPSLTKLTSHTAKAESMLPTLPLANSIGAARAAIAAPFPTMHPFPTSALLASSPMVDEDLATNIAGCVQEPLGPLGYLAVLAFSYLIYIVLPPPTHTQDR